LGLHAWALLLTATIVTRQRLAVKRSMRELSQNHGWLHAPPT
jgi:hypothetical protein